MKILVFKGLADRQKSGYFSLMKYFGFMLLTWSVMKIRSKRSRQALIAINRNLHSKSLKIEYFFVAVLYHLEVMQRICCLENPDSLTNDSSFSLKHFCRKDNNMTSEFYDWQRKYGLLHFKSKVLFSKRKFLYYFITRYILCSERYSQITMRAFLAFFAASSYGSQTVDIATRKDVQCCEKTKREEQPDVQTFIEMVKKSANYLVLIPD